MHMYLDGGERLDFDLEVENEGEWDDRRLCWVFFECRLLAARLLVSSLFCPGELCWFVVAAGWGLLLYLL